MKIAGAFVLTIASISPAAAEPKDPPIMVDFSRLVTELNDYALAAAVRTALSQQPFHSAPFSSPDVLALVVPDRVRARNEQFQFTVEFWRNGKKLGEAVESCPKAKLSDCTDQLVLDTKTAAK